MYIRDQNYGRENVLLRRAYDHCNASIVIRLQQYHEVYHENTLEQMESMGKSYIECIATTVGGSHATWMVRSRVGISQSTITY